MELQVPAEYMNVYDVPAVLTSAQRRDWYLNAMLATGALSSSPTPNPSGSPITSPLTVRPARVLAENVLALIFLPKLSAIDEAARKAQQWSLLCPDYTYDSTLLPTGPAGSPPTLAEAPLNPGANPTSATNASDVGGIDPRNQLPPEIQVIMIAIDERSAQRLLAMTPADANATTTLPDPTFGGIYTGSNGPLFTQALTGNSAYYNQLGDAETPNTDLYTFTQTLVNLKLTYRIFTTNVTIRGAKWSKAQAD
jgi:uncharacterized protein (TIGR02599 family)